MPNPHRLLFALQKLSVDFALIDRNHYLAGQTRRENDAEHSFSVALLCWFVCEHYQIKLDLAKILKYALAHDLVEVHAGDVNAFATDEEREKKIETERASLKKLSKQFEQFPDFIKIMGSYEDKSDDEALFVWTVDKMQALILGDLDDYRPYRELEIDYNWFVSKYDGLVAKSSPYAKEIFETLLEHCKSTYYDRPKQ